jgi:hypothetical protein
MNSGATTPVRSDPLLFVNYRGCDEPWAAMFLAAELAVRFGQESVFMDCLSIRLGDDFRAALLGAVARSSTLLVVIGKRWLTAGRKGHRLLDDEQDWVRREIALADATGVRVVPVLIGDAHLPAARDLPADIEFLTHRQFLHIRRRYVRSDVNDLVARLGALEPRLADASTPGHQYAVDRSDVG